MGSPGHTSLSMLTSHVVPLLQMFSELVNIWLNRVEPVRQGGVQNGIIAIRLPAWCTCYILQAFTTY